MVFGTVFKNTIAKIIVLIFLFIAQVESFYSLIVPIRVCANRDERDRFLRVYTVFIQAAWGGALCTISRWRRCKEHAPTPLII